MSPADTLQVLDRYSLVILPALAVAEQLGIPLPAVPALLGFGALVAHGRGSIPLMLGTLAMPTWRSISHGTSSGGAAAPGS